MITGLRRKAADEERAKMAPPKTQLADTADPPKCGAEDGAPPDDVMWFNTTARENLLAAVRRGPDTAWTQNVHTASSLYTLPEKAGISREDEKRLAAMQEVDAA